MARINAGSTLVNQYAPPFVVSDSVTQGWSLVWNSTLQAFEAIDPNANVVVSGFDSVQYEWFPLSNDQVYVVPFIPDTSTTIARQKAQFIVTRNGVKEQIETYTIQVDEVSNTTTITLGGSVSGDDIEIVGLQVSGGASVDIYGPVNVDVDVPGTVNASYTLPWIVPSKQTLIVTLDGVKQQVDAYTFTADPATSMTTLSFPELPGLEISSTVTVNTPGTGYEVGDTLTLVSNGTGIEPVLSVVTVFPVQGQTDANFGGYVPIGSNYSATDTITLSDGTIITVDSIGGGGEVATFTVTDTSSSAGSPNLTTLTQTSTSGIGAGFELTLAASNQAIFSVNVPSAGSYTIFPTIPTNVGVDTGSATFDITKAASARLEVIGINTAGETPASPVTLANLDGGSTDASNSPTTSVRAEVFSTKTFAGEEQIFTFRDIVAGSNVTIAQTTNSIQINADVGDFNNIGSGVYIAEIPGTQNVGLTAPNVNEAEFRRIWGSSGDTEQGRIIINDTEIPNSIYVDYNFGFKSIAQGVAGDPYIQLPNERFITVTTLGAAQGITLLAASSLKPGDTITIKNQTNETFNITLTPASGSIIGNHGGSPTTYTINTAYGYVTLYSDGTNYYVIAEG